MRRHAPVIALSVIGIVGCVSQTSPRIDLSGLNQVLPPGESQVGLMAPAWPLELVDIANRLKAGMQANPEWTMEQVAKRAPGEPLPYDPRMGITREEYGALAASKQAQLVHLTNIVLNVTIEQDGIALNSPNLPDTLLPARISFTTADLHTPLGIVPFAGFKSNATGGVFGPWVGHTWSSDDLSIETDGMISGKVIGLSILKRTSDGSRFIYYRAQMVEQNIHRLRHEVFLSLDNPDVANKPSGGDVQKTAPHS